jgi:hypothetical protein
MHSRYREAARIAHRLNRFLFQDGIGLAASAEIKTATEVAA